MSKKLREFLSIIMTVGSVLTLASIIILTLTNKLIFGITLFIGVLCIMANLCIRGLEDVLFPPKQEEDEDEE